MQRIATLLAGFRPWATGLRIGRWRTVFADRRAVTSVEYGLIALIIIIGIIVGANHIGLQLSGTFNSVSSEL